MPMALTVLDMVQDIYKAKPLGQVLTISTIARFFFARSCLGKVPGGAPFSQRSERATACTIRMQIVKQIIKRTN